MKTLFFIFSLAILLTSCATQKIITTEKCEKIINIKGSKNELYIKANEWMVRSFNSAKSVIQFQDKESGRIVGKYTLFNVSNAQFSSLDQTVSAIVTILVKDDAAKIDIEPTEGWKFQSATIWSYRKDQADYDMDQLANSFITYMGKSSTSW